MLSDDGQRHENDNGGNHLVLRRGIRVGWWGGGEGAIG
jgi:hypothetical protein